MRGSICTFLSACMVVWGWLVAGLGGCAGETADPRPQWTVLIATDAPVPQFGDRLLVEVLDDEGELACSGCRRQLGVSDASGWPISFGIAAPASGIGVHLRVRLYKAARTNDRGLPAGRLVIDYLGMMPSTNGDTQVLSYLAMNCLGQLSELATWTTCEPATGQLVPEGEVPQVEGDIPVVGSWPAGQPRDCSGRVPPEMVCVPGGVFVLGSSVGLTTSTESIASTPEHVVRVSPFALDRDEVTVGQVRQLVQAGAIQEELAYHNPDPTTTAHGCTYLGTNDASNDMLPVNCLSHIAAEKVCVAHGKRLPTEAEWEFAAGNLQKENSYSWGDDPSDVCTKAIVARGRTPLESSQSSEDSFCRTESEADVLPFGLVEGGDPDDTTELGLRNMIGNVSEWMADELARYDDPCWGGSTLLLEDPLCAGEGAGEFSIRGGSWEKPRILVSVPMRNGMGSTGQVPYVGVRCAGSMGTTQ